MTSVSHLRPYQVDAVDATVKAYYEGISCQGISMACGGGKTVVVTSLIDALPLLPGESLLFLAHRHELIDQAAAKFRQYYPDLSVGIERALEKSAPDADVVVASIQSMTPKRIKKFDPDRFRIAIVDECHHSGNSVAYQRILEHFQVHRSRESLDRRKLLVGLSATWRRGDQTGFEHLFDKIVFHRSIRDIMKQGIYVGDDWCPYLAPIRGHRELSEVKLDQVAVNKGTKDFATGDLSRAVNTPERNSAIVDAYLERGEGFPAIAFTVDIQHSHDLARAFCDRGVPFAALSGETPKEERKDIFRQYEAGRIRGLVSCGVLREGTDLPRATVGLMAQPTLSSVVYAQCFGRISRPFPAPEERLAAHQEGRAVPWVKPYGVWIDFTDSSTKHSLVQVPSLFGLRPDFNLKGKDVEQTLEAIEEAKRKNPSLDMNEIRSMDDLTRSTVAFSTTEAPQEAVEVRKWSRMPWTREGEGQYALVIRGTNSVYRVRADGEKTFWVYSFLLGSGRIVRRETTLRKAIDAAEHLLKPKEKTLLRRDAPWRREAPTIAQACAVYRDDAELRKRFRNGDAYFAYAHSQWEAGLMEFSKGSLADQLNVGFQARRVFGVRNSAHKSSWMEKARAGVRQRFASVG